MRGENDNYLSLVLFPFLVSSGQSLHWVKFQKLFCEKWLPPDNDTVVGERDNSSLLFDQVQPSAKAQFKAVFQTLGDGLLLPCACEVSSLSMLLHSHSVVFAL